MIEKTKSLSVEEQSMRYIQRPIDEWIARDNGLMFTYFQKDPLYLTNEIINLRIGEQYFTIYPLEFGLYNYLTDVEYGSSLEKIGNEVFNYFIFSRTIGYAVRDAISLEYIGLLIKSNLATKRIIIKSSLPFLNLWLSDLNLPLLINKICKWRGRPVSFIFLNRCKNCFQKIEPPIPDDNLCKKCQENYSRYFVDKQYSRVYKVVEQLLNLIADVHLSQNSVGMIRKIYKCRSRRLPVDKGGEIVRESQKMILKIAKSFYRRIVTKKRLSILSEYSFDPFSNLDPAKEDPYEKTINYDFYGSWVNSNIRQRRELIFGVLKNGSAFLEGFIKKYNLKHYSRRQAAELTKRIIKINKEYGRVDNYGLDLTN